MVTFSLHSNTTIFLGNPANRNPLTMKDNLKSMPTTHLLCSVHIKVSISRDHFLIKKLENYQNSNLITIHQLIRLLDQLLKVILCVYQDFPYLQNPQLQKQYKSAPRQVPWDTTYGVDFIPKPIGEKEQFKPTVKDGPNCGTDFGSSTYRTAYIPMPTCKQDKYRDPHQRNLYGDPGQTGNSTYQMDYIEKQNINDMCPVLALPKRPVKLQGGKSHLNYDAISNRWI